MNSDDTVENDAGRFVRSYDLFELARIARRRWRLIAACVVGGSVLGLVYFLLAQRIYESDAQILVMAKNSNLPNQSGEGVREISATTADDLFATHMQLLLSPRIVKEALDRHHLGGLASIVDFLSRDQTPEEYVIDHTDVQRGGTGRAKQGHVLSVSLKLSSAEDSAAVLSAMIESYQDFLGATFQDLSKEAMQLIAQAKDELEEELNKQEIAYKEFRERSLLLWQGEHSVNVHQLRAIEIERALSELAVRQTAVKSRLAIVEDTLDAAKITSLTDLDRLALIDDSDIRRLGLVVTVQNGEAMSEQFQATQPARSETAKSEMDRLVALQVEESSLKLELGKDHPRLRQMKESIARLNDLLESQKSRLGDPADRPRVTPSQLMASYVNLLRHDVTDLESRQHELRRQYDEEEAAAKAMVSLELEGEVISKQLQRTQALFDVVVERLRQINLTKDYGGFVTEVIAPVALGERVWPKAIICLLVSAFFGLVVGSGTAFSLEWRDQTFRNVEELRSAINFPLLATIPDMSAAVAAATTAGTTQHAGLHDSLLAFYQPKSREAEAIRGLRTALYFNNPDGELKVVQVTSANMGDGKTTIAANLAISLAQSGRRILLVDADLRQPKVAKIFGVGARSGLSDVILGKAEVSEVTRPTAVPNLWLVPCGPIPPNPAELLMQPAFAQFVETVRGQFDFIIIDTPPVLAVSDPLIVAPLADGVIVSIRFTKNGRPASIHACNMLDLPGVHVVGIVANGVDPEGGDGNGYGVYYGQSAANQNYYTREPGTAVMEHAE